MQQLVRNKRTNSIMDNGYVDLVPVEFCNAARDSPMPCFTSREDRYFVPEFEKDVGFDFSRRRFHIFVRNEQNDFDEILLTGSKF